MERVGHMPSESRSAEIQAILFTFSILSVAYDDACAAVALVLALGTAIAIAYENKYGLGYHTDEQPKSARVPYTKAFYASVVIYNIAMCIIKIGILLQYRRVFAVRMIQIITFYGTILMICWTIIIAFINIFICVPVSKFWTPDLPGRCLDSLAIWYMMAGFNLVTDLVVFCMPLPVIKSLNLPRKQKIMLFAIFSLGFFACVVSIYRIHTLKMAAETKDPNWDNVDAAIWSFLEITIAIITACLPTLKPLFSKLMPKIFASSYGQSNAQSYGESPKSLQLRSRSTKKTGGRSRVTDDTTTLKGDGAPISTHRSGISVSIRAECDGSGDEETLVGGEGGGITAKTVITQERESWNDGGPGQSRTSF
ncbi:hypothetical protein FIE12Z_11228 [Fusarium flagelliforme]|uniref:Rhodopsin domain-containing protein n=1 Tax=Fusarium flagelliforme TaxID=2675880 RepID=A0A395M9E7_9HYPO|nr:hypothetical protein FIE12Z_11228 [Fusarium flagelliforme]